MAIRRLDADPELGVRFGRNARLFAEKHFSKERVLQQYNEFFGKFEPRPA